MGPAGRSLHQPYRQPGESAGVAGAGEQAEDAGDVAAGLGVGSPSPAVLDVHIHADAATYHRWVGD